MPLPKLGFVLPTVQDPMSMEAPGWKTIRHMASTAESMGFSTVWIFDELIHEAPDLPEPIGMWECVAIASAVAASTSTITVGTWVLSALHRNPALTARVAETLDEVSGGRFLMGLGAGHTGASQAFGFPTDKIVSRYAEAIEIIVPLLRDGHANYQGSFHSSVNLPNRPSGPRPGAIPIMLAGHGPRTMNLAVRHADIWSGYATTGSLSENFKPVLRDLDVACEKAQRDPSTLGRSLGIWVEPGDDNIGQYLPFGPPISGSPDQIADGIAGFGELGITQLEISLVSGTEASFEALMPTLEALLAT